MKLPLPVSLAVGSSLTTLLLLTAVPTRPAVVPIPPGAATQEDATPETDEEAQRLRRRQAERARALGWGRDPFRPLPSAPVELQPIAVDLAEPVFALPRPQLTGISLMNGVFRAIVDRAIVRAGDVLPSGHVVTQIDDTKVTLRHGDALFTLVLGDEE